MRRVAVVVGLLLSFVALLAPWVSLGLGAGLEISLNGLGTLNLNGVTSDGMGEWAVRVRLTVLLMVVYLAMAVIAMMADHLRSRTYEIVLTVLAAVLVLFMIWGGYQLDRQQR
ncbi:hypothetical protein [Cutibacterium sp. V947]|uniref:hypothetical protein n=1 Tax=Cutibacterium sp. V947 TaxID=3446480 RepID=UPI003EE3C26B